MSASRSGDTVQGGTNAGWKKPLLPGRRDPWTCPKPLPRPGMQRGTAEMTVWQTVARKLVCDRRGHKIVQLPSPAPDPEPLLVLKCTRCGLREEHPLRKLNREERRRAAKAA